MVQVQPERMPEFVSLSSGLMHWLNLFTNNSPHTFADPPRQKCSKSYTWKQSNWNLFANLQIWSHKQPVDRELSGLFHLFFISCWWICCCSISVQFMKYKVSRFWQLDGLFCIQCCTQWKKIKQFKWDEA